MSFFKRIFGRPLATHEQGKQKLSIMTGIPALGLDSFASTAYGPEAALTILLPLGAAGIQYFSMITLGVIAVLITLYLSYWQTAAAYPDGGGAYIVASDNLGKRYGLWAAISLLMDYLLNVAVGISAGTGAIVSAIPALQPYTLLICLTVLAMLTMLNLRGIRETGITFFLPVLAFVILMGVTLSLGIFHLWQSGGHPHPVMAPPTLPPVTEAVSIWLLLGAFANGLTAMTGIEAVSNAVPLFQKNSVKNAQWTLTIIIAILGLFLLGLGYLCPAYHLVAMNETLPGYQTVLSQLVMAVTGKGVFYYFSIASIFTVLVYSAQTSFVGFPRVCRLLADDCFLPPFFAEKGRRLVFSSGIIMLTVFSGILLVLFNGVTLKLIPLFAVGAFSAFLFSQTGMVVHWLRKKNKPYARVKIFFNAVGAITTLVALIIIIVSKFIEGAWIIILVSPVFFLLLISVNQRYKKISIAIDKPLELQIDKLQPPAVIVPIDGWNRVAEKAIRFGMLLSADVTAVYINVEKYDERIQLEKTWSEKVKKPALDAGWKSPELVIINSPYRRIYQPVLDFVNEVKKTKPDRLIAVVIPELIEPHWYESLLHNIHAAGLRALLFLERDQRTVVVTAPWYLR